MDAHGTYPWSHFLILHGLITKYRCLPGYTDITAQAQVHALNNSLGTLSEYPVAISTQKEVLNVNICFGCSPWYNSSDILAVTVSKVTQNA